MQTQDIRYVVLGGGGVRGQAYAAALDEMRALLRINFRNLKGVAGTSIGSLYAAALANGMSTHNMLAIARDTSLIDLVSPHVSNLFSHRGLDVGGTVTAWIDGHLGSRQKTFRELFQETGIHLKVFVTNLKTCKSESLCHETHPNLPVCRGVFMSMCLPPLFAPCEMNDSLYVDGGLLQNFPIKAFANEEETIGLRVSWNLCNTLDSFETYFSRLTYCSLNAASDAQYDALSDAYKERTLTIGCGDVSTLHWRVPSGMAVAMESRGREAVRDFVKQFNLRALPLDQKRTASVSTQTETGTQKNVSD